MCSYQTVLSTRPRSKPPAYPFTLVQFANSTAIILPPNGSVNGTAEPETTERRVTPHVVSKSYVPPESLEFLVNTESHLLMEGLSRSARVQ